MRVIRESLSEKVALNENVPGIKVAGDSGSRQRDWQRPGRRKGHAMSRGQTEGQCGGSVMSER